MRVVIIAEFHNVEPNSAEADAIIEALTQDTTVLADKWGAEVHVEDAVCEDAGVTVLSDPYNPPGFPGSIYEERDLAHEADLRRQAREQLRLDCMDEEASVPYEPTPLDEYEF